MLKKTLFLLSLLIGLSLSSLTYAGGPDNMDSPVTSPSTAKKNRGIYIDAGAGLAMTHWLNRVEDIHSTFDGTIITLDNKRGGFVYGADLGYQFNDLLSLEVGYYNLPNFNSTLFSPFVEEGYDWYHANSDFLYGAGKLSLPFFIDHLTIFGKLGVAFHNLKRIWTEYYKADVSFSSPFAAVGLQYYLNGNLSTSLQYIATHGTTDIIFDTISPKRGYVYTPNAYLILLNVGYRFNI